MKAIKGVSIQRIEPDDLVNMSEIAARLNQSERASASTSTAMRWRWNEVAQWLIANGELPDCPILREAMLVSKLNAAPRITASPA
jgi:hypothetical protein